MGYNPEIHHRRSIRLKGYDYGQSGLYFITICAWERQCIFGSVRDGEMQLSEFGEVARDEWLRTPVLRPNIDLAEFVIMPNHIHGIIVIEDMDMGVKNDDRGAMHRARTEVDVHGDIDEEGNMDRGVEHRAHADKNDDTGAMHRARTEVFGKPTSNTIPTIVRGYKAAVTKQINILRNAPQRPVWQRNYYEHIVRSEADYLRIATYIIDNPRKWHEDSLCPNVK
jgi:putative transposase